MHNVTLSCSRGSLPHCSHDCWQWRSLLASCLASLLVPTEEGGWGCTFHPIKLLRVPCQCKWPCELFSSPLPSGVRSSCTKFRGFSHQMYGTEYFILPVPSHGQWHKSQCLCLSDSLSSSVWCLYSPCGPEIHLEYVAAVYCRLMSLNVASLSAECPCQRMFSPGWSALRGDVGHVLSWWPLMFMQRKFALTKIAFYYLRSPNECQISL